MKRNLLAGLANSVWSVLIVLAAVPFYLKYLGVEAYGLIGFFITIQAVMSLLDMGMSPTINREVARCLASGDIKEAGKLLHTLAVVYWCLAVVIALLILVLAPLIAEYWLQPKQLSSQTISHAVMLMGLVVACRWPIGLYHGALIGAQRLTVSSGINMIMVTIGSLGAVSVLAFVSPTIEAFFIWQACIGLVYAITIRIAAWRIIGKPQQNKFDIDKLKSVWRFTAGMSGIALTALVFMQLDKIMLSNMLGLEEFGHYMLATIVVSGLYVLVSPVFNVIYPRMTVLVTVGNTEKLIDLYRLGTRMFASVIFPVAMVLAIFAKDLVFVWTGNMGIASSVAPIISLLAIGSALHCVMYFPYAMQLAHGITRLPLTINAILLLFWVPLIIFFTLTHGALGGAMAWLVLHVFYVLLGIWMTHRSLLKGIGAKWLFQDVGIPLMLSIMVGQVSLYVAQDETYSILVKLISASILALVVSALSISMSPQLRTIVLNSLKKKKIAAA